MKIGFSQFAINIITDWTIKDAPHAIIIFKDVRKHGYANFRSISRKLGRTWNSRLQCVVSHHFTDFAGIAQGCTVMHSDIDATIAERLKFFLEILGGLNPWAYRFMTAGNPKLILCGKNR